MSNSFPDPNNNISLQNSFTVKTPSTPSTTHQPSHESSSAEIDKNQTFLRDGAQLIEKVQRAIATSQGRRRSGSVTDFGTNEPIHIQDWPSEDLAPGGGGILKKNISSSATTSNANLNSESRNKPRSRSSNIRWKDPIEQFRPPSAVVKHTNVPVKKEKFPKIMTASKILTPTQPSTSGGKRARSTKTKKSGPSVEKRSKSKSKQVDKISGPGSPPGKKLFTPPSTAKAHPTSSQTLAAVAPPGDPIPTSDKTHPALSLSDFVAQAKLGSTPPPFPSLKVCDVLPGTKRWDEYWEHFNGQIASYQKSMDSYVRGRGEFSKDLEEYSRRLKRSVADDLAFQTRLGLKPGDKKPPLLHQPLTLPITLLGPYVIQRKIKTKTLPSPTIVHLTSFDHQSFRLEIGLDPGFNETGPLEYKPLQLIPNETYFISIDCKFNTLSVKVALPSTARPPATNVYKEEILIVCPDEKSACKDLQVSSSQLDGGRIIVNGK